MEHQQLSTESGKEPEIHAASEPEKLGDILVRKALIPENIPQEAETTPEHAIKKPDAILQKVLEAAERNNPLERLYELRHEIKDHTSNDTTLEEIVAGQVAAVKSEGIGIQGKALRPRMDSLMRSSLQRQKYVRYAWNGAYIAMGIIIIMLLFLIVG